MCVELGGWLISHDNNCGSLDQWSLSWEVEVIELVLNAFEQVLLQRQLCSTVPRKPARQGGGWYQRIASCQVIQSRMNTFRLNNFFSWGCYLWGRVLVWRRWLWTLRRERRRQLETHAGRFQEHQINLSELFRPYLSMIHEQLMLDYFLRANLPELSPLYCFRTSALT